MKTTTLARHTNASSEASMTTAFSNKTRVQRPALIKLLTTPTPPSEQEIRTLNEIAATAPFCRPYKAKNHDTL